METKNARPRFTEEIKIKAVKQVSKRGHAVAEVAERLGVSARRLCTWTWASRVASIAWHG